MSIPDFKPVNPWGRAMPKPVRPVSEKRVQLWQLVVDINGVPTRVFPKMLKAPLEDLLEVVSKQIIKGNEKVWKNPRLVAH